MRNVKKVPAPLVRILYLRASKRAAMECRDTVERSSGHTGASRYGVVRVADEPWEQWAVVALPRKRIETMAEIHERGPLD